MQLPSRCLLNLSKQDKKPCYILSIGEFTMIVKNITYRENRHFEKWGILL